MTTAATGPSTAAERAEPSSDAVDRALVAVSLAGIAYLFVQILLYGFGRDQGIYAVVADAVLRGEMPYRDAWDFKPPGIFLVYALARGLFGHHPWSIRLVEVLGLASMLVAFARFSRRFFGDARIGVVGGALAVLVHAQLEFWHTAQPESFGAIATAWAILLSTVPSDAPARRRFACWVGAGALYGFAALLKPPLGGGAIVSSLFAAWSMRRAGRAPLACLAPIGVMAAASITVVAACALWFLVRGAWPDLYQTLFLFTPHYTQLSWSDGSTLPGAIYLAIEEWFVTYSSASFAGLLLLFALPPIADREREGMLHVLGVVLVQLVGVALQGKYFPYHYGASLPLGGLLAGLGAWKAWRRLRPLGLAGVLLFALGAWGAMKARSATRDTETDYLDRCQKRIAWLLGPRTQASRDALDGRLYSVADVNHAANREVGELLAARTRPDERVFVWGFEPVIYDTARRLPASRYVYDVPQRVAWDKERSRAILLSDLRASRPAAIVVEHRDVFPSVTGDAIDSADTLRGFPDFERLLEDEYTPGAVVEDFDVYWRRDR